MDANTGRFDFAKVVPGPYVSYVFLDGNTVRNSVDVRSGDVDGVFLPFTPGVNIPVRIRFEGEPPKDFPNMASLRPTLWREPTLFNAPAMPATPGASLVLQNIAPGDYRVYVQPLFTPLTGANPVAPQPRWQNAYVKSIRLGDMDVLNGGLHFRSEPSDSLDLVIAANPGLLEGRVINDSNEPVPGAVVTLFANTPSERLYRTDMYRVTSTDTTGQFQVQGLPPGDYKVFAWEGVENGSWMDTNFLVSYESRGRTVHIEEGKTSRTDLPVIAPR